MNALNEPTHNLYQSLVIIAQRANQIQSTEKEELQDKLKDFVTFSENIEEFFENREQIEISKHYERQPKPVLRALDEFEVSKVYWRRKED